MDKLNEEDKIALNADQMSARYAVNCAINKAFLATYKNIRVPENVFYMYAPTYKEGFKAGISAFCKELEYNLKYMECYKWEDIANFVMGYNINAKGLDYDEDEYRDELSSMVKHFEKSIADAYKKLDDETDIPF